jgi:hypothetical protein
MCSLVSRFVFLAVFLIGILSFLDQMHHANVKEFWGDEIYSLKNTIQRLSYGGLIRKEAVRFESNAAPLDYLCTKVLDDSKQKIGSFGLSDKVYYRLWANFVMVLSGLVVTVLFIRNILISSSIDPVRIFQLLLIIFLPFLYLYRPMTYHYAAEVRPYALWFALWFISIGICSLSRINKFILALCLCLLAMTMVGSVFQILALGMAYFAVRWQQSGWKLAIKDSLHVFTIPIILVVFYAFPAAYGQRSVESSASAWQRFYELWSHEATIIPMLLVSIVALYQSKETRSMIIGPLAVLIVFLMGPLICWTTLSRGYFVTERQYIYYDAHRAVFWLSLINFLPFYLEKIKDQKKKMVVMAIICIFGVLFVFPKKTIFHIQEAIHHAFNLSSS